MTSPYRIPAVTMALLCVTLGTAGAQAKADTAKQPAPPRRTLQTRVWVNTSTRVYHCPTSPYYAKTKDGEFMEEAAARARGYHAVGRRACGNVVTKGPAPLPDTTEAARRMVWVNTDSKIYHCPGSSDWGTTRRGRYLSEADATAAKFKPARGKTCLDPAGAPTPPAWAVTGRNETSPAD